ncbi:J domain-containing protein, partial [Clostridium perfringens]|uniref:J domain-containing protein n=2 Tax=Clostridium TaxID=1485 RepID=UPI002AC72801
MDPYKVLGITPDSSKDEIKQAYKNILDEYNPNNSDFNSRPLAEEVISEANIAYDV